MRNIISLAHISLDGFMADAGGKIDYVVFSGELADHTYPLMASVDLAVYGRVTYEMMEGYWPTAGARQDATADTKNHARWYAGVKKIVASRTLAASTNPNVRVVGDDIAGAREVASAATSGAEGAVFMSAVRRLGKKVAAARARLQSGSGARKPTRRRVSASSGNAPR